MCSDLDRSAFPYHDMSSHRWKVDRGQYEILIGSSSQDIRLRSTISYPHIDNASRAETSAAHMLDYGGSKEGRSWMRVTSAVAIGVSRKLPHLSEYARMRSNQTFEVRRAG